MPVSERPTSKVYLQLLLALVVAFQGLALVITSNKAVSTYWWMRVVGLAMAVAGFYYLYRILPREVLQRPIDDEAKARAARDMVMELARSQRETTLADRFIHKVTFRGRLVPLFPVFGVVIIVIDLLWNLVLIGSSRARC